MEKVNHKDHILRYFTRLEGLRKTYKDAEKYISGCLG